MNKIKESIHKCKTFDSINNFCLEHTNFCINNKEKICKKLLNVSDNKVKNNFCENYELTIKTQLSNITNIHEIGEFCRTNGEFCINNKGVVCKQILHINQYETNYSFNNCHIYKELLTLARSIGAAGKLDMTGNVTIKMSKYLLNKCEKKASDNLRRFLLFNNINIGLNYYSRESQVYRPSITAKMPIFSKTQIIKTSII